MEDSLVDETMLRDASFVGKGYAMTRSYTETTSSLKHRAYAHHIESIALLILTGECTGLLPEKFARIWVVQVQMRRIKPDQYRADSSLR